MPRRHRLMLLAAFEILVLGLTQAWLTAPRRSIVIEITTTPNHVVT